MDSEKKKAVFEKRITIETLQAMREKFLSLPQEMTHAVRATIVAPAFTQFTTKTLEDYSRICTQVCQEVFDYVVEGKISITALAEFAGGWEEKTQKYIAKEYIEQGLTPTVLRTIKQLQREHRNMGYSEAISRAKGEIPIDQPRKEQKKSIDQVLTQIADLGVRWRALVEMASEMVRDEEASSGVHESIIEKAFILRQLVGEQYDAINARVNRWMNSARKKVKEVTQQSNPLEPGQVEIVPPGTGGPKMIDAEFTARPGNDAGESPAEEQ